MSQAFSSLSHETLAQVYFRWFRVRTARHAQVMSQLTKDASFRSLENVNLPEQLPNLLLHASTTLAFVCPLRVTCHQTKHNSWKSIKYIRQRCFEMLQLMAASFWQQHLDSSTCLNFYRQRVCKTARHTSCICSCILESQVSRDPERNPERASNPGCMIAINDLCSSFTLLAFPEAATPLHMSVPLKG